MLCMLVRRQVYLVGESFFFFNDTATTEIYTLSLHDALPIALDEADHRAERQVVLGDAVHRLGDRLRRRAPARSAYGRELALRRPWVDRPLLGLLHLDGLHLERDRGVAPAEISRAFARSRPPLTATAAPSRSSRSVSI